MALMMRTSPLWSVAPAYLGSLRRFSGATNQVVELTTDNEYKDAVAKLSDSGKLGVFDFTAKWCGPCRQVAPILEELSNQNPEVAFYKIDIDNPAVVETVTQAGISAVPTFLFIKGPKRAEMFSGARVELLKSLVEQHK